MMIFETMLRLIVLVILGSTYLIFRLYQSKPREETAQLSPEKTASQGSALRYILLLPLLAVLLLDIFVPDWIRWTKFNLPDWLQIIGALVALISLIWLWWVFKTIGGENSERPDVKEAQRLITSGPYNLMRHPLYAGALLMLFSFCLIFQDWFLMIYFVGGILVFRLLVIPEEEQQLLEVFGEDYEVYQSRTSALLPWMR